MAKRNKAALGDLVEVKWLDAASFTNQPISKARPAQATSRGILVRDARDHLVLECGIYSEDGPDPDGDFTVIPKGIGWLQSIRVLVKAKDMEAK